MLILSTFLLMASTAILLPVLRWRRPRFRFSWLLAIGLTSAALVGVLLWQQQLPFSLSFSFWKNPGFVSVSPEFLADSFSWPYALGLVALQLAILLTAPARPGFPNSNEWAISLGVGAVCVLAITASNLPTLAVAWAILDLAELTIILRWTSGHESTSRAVLTFCVRLGGIALVLFAYALAAGKVFGSDPVLTSLPNGILLVIAVALRVCMLPATTAQHSQVILRGALITTVQLASTAASLSLLSRLPKESLTSPLVPVLLMVFVGIGLYASWAWFRAPDDLSSRPFWFLGVSSLAVSSALRGNPVGATGWGTALILTGGALFLSHVHRGWMNRALLLGGWAISSMPFSLTASAWKSDTDAAQWLLPGLMIAQVLLVAGFVHKASRVSIGSSPDSQTEWLKIAYPAGIFLLLMVQFIPADLDLEGVMELGTWAASLIVFTALILAWLARRIPRFDGMPESGVVRFASRSMDQVTQSLGMAYRGLQLVSFSIANLLEGEGGVMWSLVLLALFVSLIIGSNR